METFLTLGFRLWSQFCLLVVGICVLRTPPTLLCWSLSISTIWQSVFFFVVFLPLEIFTYWLEHALLLGIPIYLICVGKISVPQNTFQDTLGNVFFSNCNLLIILVVDNLTTYIFRLGFYGLWFMGTVPLFNPVTFSHIFASKSQFNFVPLHYWSV